MSVRSGRWEATSASVRGSAHERDGRPNQDSVRVVDVGGSTPGLVAAVCDGHGGERYVRSDTGSRFGTEVACDIGRRFLAAFGASDDLTDVRSQLRSRVAESVVERWRERVIDDVRRRPFTADERTRARTRGDLDDDPLISYGCTLVLAIAGPLWVAFVQIGDGDVTVVRGSDATEPMPPDDRLVGGETTSLCLPTAVADARIELVGEPLPDMVILTTDGYANSFASPAWRSDIGLDMRRQLDDHGLAQVEAHLPGWLSDSARAGGDDVSMALVSRREPGAAWSPGETTVRNDALAAPLADAATAPRPTSPPAPGRRRSRAALLAAVPALAVGLGGGWALGRGGDGDAPTATAPTVSTPTVSALVTLATLPVTAAPPPTVPGVATPSIPQTAPQPASTDPVASTSVAEAAPTTEVPGEAVVLAGTSGEGWLLRFDTAAPQPVPGQVMLLGSVRSSKPAVPLRWVMTTQWQFDGAQLCFGTEPCYPAVGVLWPGDVPRDPDLVWTTDTRVLRSFDANSGAPLGCAVVSTAAAAVASNTAPSDTAPDEVVPTGTTPDASPAGADAATCDPTTIDTTTPPGSTTAAPDEENG